MLEKSIPLIPVSIGEIVDKISILKIKYKKITDIAKLKNVDIELQELKLKFEDLGAFDQIETEIKNLDIVNEQLWKIEDDIREKESSRTLRRVTPEPAWSRLRHPPGAFINAPS